MLQDLSVENGLREGHWRNYVNYIIVIKRGIIWLWVWAFFTGQSVSGERVYIGSWVMPFLVIIYRGNNVDYYMVVIILIYCFKNIVLQYIMMCDIIFI